MEQENHTHKDFLNRLYVKKNELEEALRRLMQSQKEYNAKSVDDAYSDEFDSAQKEIVAFSNYGLMDRKNKELKKIEHLIQKISRDEDFGICEECEEPIPTDRLLIVPEANLCVDCQSEMEEFDHLRTPAANVSSGFRGKRAMEWGDSRNLDDMDDDVMESEFNIIPDVEMEGPEREESP
ncbi:MAG: TraR/DksA family transcriptional regulator [Desulfobacteraceae bacterium]|nr:TraR/DksA family transcriptional regulator [Desulfobacteraceae bacterium]